MIFQTNSGKSIKICQCKIGTKIYLIKPPGNYVWDVSDEMEVSSDIVVTAKSQEDESLRYLVREDYGSDLAFRNGNLIGYYES